MAEKSAIFEDMEEILKKIYKHIERIEQTNREIADALRLLSELQNRVIQILKDMHEEVKMHTKILKEHSAKLDEHSAKLSEISARLDEHSAKLDEHSAKLDDHTAKLDRIIRDIRDIKECLRRLIGELEDEAKEVVSVYLGKKYGYQVKLERFEIKDVLEINLYGSTDNICIVGECKNRIGPSVLLKVCMDADKMVKHRPALLKKRVMLIVYGLRVVDIAKLYARKYGIGIITPTGFIVEPKIQNVAEIRRNIEELKKILSGKIKDSKL